MRRLIPIIVLLSACAAPRDVPRLRGDWQYSLDGKTWREEVTPDGVHDYRMRVRVPDGYTHAVLRAYVGAFDVSLDTQPIYAFHDPRSDGRLTLHVIPLRSAATLLIRIPRARDVALISGAPYLATTETLPLALRHAAFDPLSQNASDLILGMLFCVIGAIAVAASLLGRRGDPLALRYFGLFTLLYGARLLIDSPLPFALGGSVRTFDFLASFITYIIPIAGWALPLHLIGNGWRSSLRLQVIAFALFAPIGIASDLITRTPGSLETVNNVLIVAGAVNILLNLLRAEQRRTRELRIVLAGAFVFLLFALNNNLVSLGVMPWTFSDETLGFAICVAALGYASTRAFLRGERERVAIDDELKTAREIQRSILPTSMPEVRGLRVQAAYDPASSVAGDLYDFVRVDEHRVGVLVADVAGHGVPAALIASMVKIAFSSQSRLAGEPAALLRELNETLGRVVRRAFVTATYLWFDLEKRSVTVCNAGHAPPLLLRDGAFHDLGGSGVLLGRFASARYTDVTTELQSGDRIVAFTDGIVEARNVRDEQFGEERLRAVIARGLPNDVITEVHQWRAGADPAQADDLTVVMVDVDR